MSESNEANAECFTMPVPGEEHALLQPLEGTFKSEVQMWMGPGDPMMSTGTITSAWHINGLYLNQDYVGDKSDGPFPDFAGKGYMGFNTTSKKFEGFWIDNASTTMQMESGNVDDSGKVWTMFSEVQCPQSGQTMKKRSVVTVIDNDHNKMEMFFETPEGESKGMEINYTRA